MGKWSKLKEKFARFQEEPSWQAKIDEEKVLYAADNRANRCKLFAEAKGLKEDHEEEIKKLNVTLEALTQLLVEDLEAQDEAKITNSLGTFSIKDDPYPQVKDRRAYLYWIHDNGLDDLLTVNYQTTAGQVKDRLDKGLELPAGIDVFIKTKIGFYPSREGTGPLKKDKAVHGLTGVKPE